MISKSFATAHLPYENKVMFRTITTLTIAMHCLLFASAEEPKVWRTFDSPDGIFSISLPETPASLKPGAGVQGSFYSCESKELQCTFTIGCSELPKFNEGQPVEKLFELAIEANSGEHSVTKIIEKRITNWQDKYKALEMTCVHKKSEVKDTMIRSLAVATPKHFIAIQITGAKSSIEGKQIEECLASLKVKE